MDARAHQGQWLVRIEDIDPPREQPGAADAILSTLEAHGLHWDEAVRYQSQQHQRYEERLQQLADQGRLFYCHCTRKQLKGLATYPGTCRQHTQPSENTAVRLAIGEGTDRFEDLFQGWQQADLAQHCGDVILKRRDGLWAYQLAVVSDDIDQNITHLIRGTDLLFATFWQRSLTRLLGGSAPIYGHHPVLVAGNDKQKLSKQNRAPGVINKHAPENLGKVLSWLGIKVDQDTPSAMLQAATAQWQRQRLQGQAQIHLGETDANANSGLGC